MDTLYYGDGLDILREYHADAPSPDRGGDASHGQLACETRIS